MLHLQRSPLCAWPCVRTHVHSLFLAVNSRLPLRPTWHLRSVLFARFEGQAYLLCGLGDGHLLTWRVEGEGLAERKKLALGTKPVTLRTFK